eukprot:scaffold37694_cov25-Tisochrysis_lutea.AAC.1
MSICHQMHPTREAHIGYKRWTTHAPTHRQMCVMKAGARWVPRYCWRGGPQASARVPGSCVCWI